MINKYRLEDEIRLFIKDNITEFYSNDISSSLNKPFLEVFNSLHELSKNNTDKIKMLFEIRCPNCNKRIKEYTDLSDVKIKEPCICKDYGEFIIEKDNTYIFFRATDEWVNAVKEIEAKNAIKTKEKELAKLKNEKDIIKQLSRVLDIFDNIPEGELSIEGKIIRSQINTYLNSKKEAI